MGLIFKNLPNKWIMKGREQGHEEGLEQGREQEYKRITEELRRQGIDYTPQPPEDMNKK